MRGGIMSKTFRQDDPRWKNHPYPSNPYTMYNAGCGPTACADIIVNIAKCANYTPDTIRPWMISQGFATRGHGTTWAGIPKTLQHYGFKTMWPDTMPKFFKEMAKKNRWGILLFTAGKRGGVEWTRSGHFVAVTDYKKEDGKHYLYTRDPNGDRRNDGWHCYETTMKGLIPQCWVAWLPDGTDPAKETPETAADFPERGYWKNGDMGDGVKDVQKLLNKANAGTIKPKLKIDGKFGDKTEAATEFLQEVRHITIDGKFGPKSLEKCKKKVTKAMRAVNWAVSVAKDNSFAYGTGERAHRLGCYFCQTNTGPRMKKKERPGEPHYVTDSKGRKHTYEKTYVCMTFATAAYAHGAKDPEMYKICHDGSASISTTNSNFKNYKCWKKVGQCKNLTIKDLKAGDLVIRYADDNRSGHIWMYTGADGIVEASGGTWDADSIAHKSGAADRLKQYGKNGNNYVMRYKG